MARHVLITKNLEAKLDSLPDLKEEVSGVLLYREKNGCCVVEYIFLTGADEEGYVDIRSERADIINEFFKMNPDYNYVEFHTHSRGTIEKYGQHYARNFSPGDLKVLRDKSDNSSDYMSMLITPEKKLLYGIDNPSLVSVEKFVGCKRREQSINEALNVIINNLGYNVVA
jgi:hypothetical protein